MIDIVGIFRNRTLHIPRLLAFGFLPVESGYVNSFSLLNGQFEMIAAVSETGTVSVRVIDTESRDDYALVHAANASGAFIGSVIQACEKELRIVADECFYVEVFKSTQAKQIIDYVDATYHDKLEFLWAKTPGNAVLRRKDTGKWYAAVLTLPKSKLGFDSTELVEIIDLRALPEELTAMVDGKRYLAGYHMNKKHWYTICLDGSVGTEEICARIDASYLLAKK